MELENLRKAWKEQKTASFDKEAILAMLKKKSSSVAKWIFIVSICEFALMLALSVLFPKDNTESLGVSYNLVSDVVDIVGYFLIFVFMFLFFLNYRRIKSKDDVATLLSNILRTRKTVEYYIYSNIVLFVFFSIYNIYWLFHSKFPLFTWEDSTVSQKAMLAFFIFGGILITVVFIILIYLFYRLLYGFLLKRLRKNYNEIKKII